MSNKYMFSMCKHDKKRIVPYFQSYKMPPKKKVENTRSSTDIFLVGQPRKLPCCRSKPLTNGDVLRYLFWMKGQDEFKSYEYDSLAGCPLIKGTCDSTCLKDGGQREDSDREPCCVFFSKNIGGWLKTGIPLVTDKAIKRKILDLVKDWQDMNKKKKDSANRTCPGQQSLMLIILKSKWIKHFGLQTKIQRR